MTVSRARAGAADPLVVLGTGQLLGGQLFSGFHVGSGVCFSTSKACAFQAGDRPCNACTLSDRYRCWSQC
jgi:hypothetical protein